MAYCARQVSSIRSSKVLPEGFHLNITAVNGEDGTKLKPDVCLLFTRAAVTSWSWCFAELFVEFKRSPSSDPWCDYQTLLEYLEHANNDGLDKIKGQLVSYFAALFSRQHRTHAFSIFVAGDFARFMRWDHSGAIVSQRINYRQDPQILAEFLWRYCHLLRAQRGFDTTAQLASSAKRKLFMDAVKDSFKDPDVLKGRSLANPADHRYLCHKLTVTDTQPEGNPSTRHFITQKALSDPLSPFGRSTHGYIAMDLATKNLVFLKDYWAFDDGGQPTEPAIYKELEGLAVPHIPKILLAGDVLDDSGLAQETLTPKFMAENETTLSMSRPLKHYRHTRVVQPLAFFPTVHCHELESSCVGDQECGEM